MLFIASESVIAFEYMFPALSATLTMFSGPLMEAIATMKFPNVTEDKNAQDPANENVPS